MTTVGKEMPQTEDVHKPPDMNGLKSNLVNLFFAALPLASVFGKPLEFLQMTL